MKSAECCHASRASSFRLAGLDHRPRGWGWRTRTSEFGDVGRGNQALTLKCCANRSPIILAETTGLRLQTERQCRHVDAGLLASSRILPRWRYRHCGASVMTARLPSQTERALKMSHRNTPHKTKLAPTKRTKKPAKVEKVASGSTRGGTKQETV